MKWDYPLLARNAPGLTWDGVTAIGTTTHRILAPDNRASIRHVTRNQKAAIAALTGTLANSKRVTKPSGNRHQYPGIADKFVAHMGSRPDFVFGVVDKDALAKDRQLVGGLLPNVREFAQHVESMEYANLRADSDTMLAILAFSQDVKQVAARDVHGAGTINNELKTRFPCWHNSTTTRALATP